MKYTLINRLSGIAAVHQVYLLLEAVIGVDMTITGSDWEKCVNPEEFTLDELSGKITIKNNEGLGAIIEWTSRPLCGLIYTPMSYQIYRIAPEFDTPQLISQVSGILGVAETAAALLSIINSFPEIRLNILTHDPQVLHEGLSSCTSTTLPLFDDYADVFGKFQEDVNLGKTPWVRQTSQRLAGLGYHGNAQLILATSAKPIILAVFTAWNKDGKFAQFVNSFIIEEEEVVMSCNSLEYLDDVISCLELTTVYSLTKN